jgi:hypothetical protein
MPEKQKKRPHEMTTDEAMEYLFGKERKAAIKQAFVEHDANKDRSLKDDGPDALNHEVKVDNHDLDGTAEAVHYQTCRSPQRAK